MAEQIETDYEKISYGKFGYKRIRRLRRKGARRGIEVPPLGYELNKPEKPRVVFWIAAGVGLAVFAALLVGAGFLIKYLIDLCTTHFKQEGGGEFIETLLNPQIMFVTQGVSLLPVILLIVGYLLLACIGILPVMLLIYCFRYVRNMLYLARCPKEEFAKGEFISSRIINHAGILIVSTALLIGVCCLFDAPYAKQLIGLIYAGVVLVFGSLLAIIIAEKVKCKKWFATLDNDKQENYLAHAHALARVKRRLRSEKDVWNNTFR